MGLFITLAEPTAPMKKGAVSAGTLATPFNSKATYNVGLLGEGGRDRMRDRTAACSQEETRLGDGMGRSAVIHLAKGGLDKALGTQYYFCLTGLRVCKFFC